MSPGLCLTLLCAWLGAPTHLKGFRIEWSRGTKEWPQLIAIQWDNGQLSCNPWVEINGNKVDCNLLLHALALRRLLEEHEIPLQKEAR